MLSSAGTQIQIAFSVVGLLGILVFGLSWYFSRAIASDITALSMAVSPGPGTFTADSTTVDSFWTSGER